MINTRLNRTLAVLMLLTVPLFLVACQDEGVEEEDELGLETEGMEQTPTEPAPTTAPGSFTAWDADADRALTEEEFDTGLEEGTWWSEWDADANENLSQEEFDSAFGEYDWYEEGLFGEWDADGNGELSEEEWEAGLFETLDEDGDGTLGEQEYDEDLFS